MSLTTIKSRGSLGSHTRPSRPGFKLYWEVRNGSGWYVDNFPGDDYYPGLTLGKTVGLHSRTVQATIQADMEGVLWSTRAITGGTGGVPSTTLAVSANGTRVDTGVRITGTGIPADTFITAYDSWGSNTGNLTLSQSATVSAGTALTVWRQAGKMNVIGGTGGVSTTTITVASGGLGSCQVNANIFGYGIPAGTRVVSYDNTADSGPMVVSQAVNMPNGINMHSSNGAELAQIFFADYESGGESGSDVQNWMTWMRGATGYSYGSYPKGYDSPPIGNYGNNQCAMNRPSYQPMVWTASELATRQASNDLMVSGTTGTGNAACDWIGPEAYCYNRLDMTSADLRWYSSEYVRMGLTPKLIPLINPQKPPGWVNNWSGNTCPGKYWRGILETAIHDPNIYGLYIWHGDRSTAWDATEEWLVETLDFIDTYGITNGSPF